MQFQKKVTTVVLLSLSSLFISCVHYLDTTKTTVVNDINSSKFVFYPSDSNVLIFNSNIALRADNEITESKYFTVKLPKKLLYYEFSNSENFVFFYPQQQCILINTNSKNKPIKEVTVISPSEGEISKLLNNSGVTNSKYNIRSITVKNGRKNCIIETDEARILLYNIKQGNYDLYLSTVKSFKFL